jgi:hypothetical protein
VSEDTEPGFEGAAYRTVEDTWFIAGQSSPKRDSGAANAIPPCGSPL